jgi:ribonuclease P protein component
MRFRPEQHLRRQSDFRAIREQGRRLNCGAFTLWCLLRPASTPPIADPANAVSRPHESVDVRLRRLGVVASTASVGHAVLRNRAKRRLRDVFRRHQEQVPVGCDILMSARANAVDVPMVELEQKFVDACRKVTPRPNA